MSEVVRTAGQGSWEQLYGYSRAIQVGPWVMTSGCTAMVEGAVTHVNDPAGQTKAAFRVALDHLVEAGAGRFLAVADPRRGRLDQDIEALDLMQTSDGQNHAAAFNTQFTFNVFDRSCR